MMMELLGSVFAFSKILPMFLIDVSKKENHLPIELVDLGTGTKSLTKIKRYPRRIKTFIQKRMCCHAKYFDHQVTRKESFKIYACSQCCLFVAT